jgi:hypothetical protein
MYNLSNDSAILVISFCARKFEVTFWYFQNGNNVIIIKRIIVYVHTCSLRMYYVIIIINNFKYYIL